MTNIRKITQEVVSEYINELRTRAEKAEDECKRLECALQVALTEPQRDPFIKERAQLEQEWCQLRAMQQRMKTELRPRPEPVAWMDPANKASDQAFAFKEDRDKWPHIYKTALYAAPPTQRQPLDDYQILELAAGELDCVDEEYIKRFARAIERAHGIVS